MGKYKIRKDLSMEYNGRTLYRIEALREILKHNIEKGDIGGWIEKETNLSQDGDCWISDEAKVYDNAEIYDDALVIETAEVYGFARVYDKSNISGNSEVYGNAGIFDKAWIENAVVCEKAWVRGKAWVHQHSRICGDADIRGSSRIYLDVIKNTKEVYNIILESYFDDITITPNYITIGCETHSKEEWWQFTDRDIGVMYGEKFLNFWKKWKPILQSICEEK